MRRDKNVCDGVSECDASDECRSPAATAHPSAVRRAVWTRPLLCGILSFLTGGCATSKIVQLKDEADFNRQALQAQQPAVVDFYKGGCPTCVMLDGTFNKLAGEYEGRVLFARLELMKPYFAVTAPRLRATYRVRFYPTVVLIVHGEEKHRWVAEYDSEKYRAVLDEALASQKTPSPDLQDLPAAP